MPNTVVKKVVSRMQDLQGLRLAKRCQLLVGSWSGASGVCGCSSSRFCKLSVEERKEYGAHQKVIERAQENWKQYKESVDAT